MLSIDKISFEGIDCGVYHTKLRISKEFVNTFQDTLTLICLRLLKHLVSVSYGDSTYS